MAKHDDVPLPPEIEAWELDLVRKVAKAFRDCEQDELTAELASRLLELKSKPPTGIKNWRAYLAKFLYNKASNIVRNWRLRDSRSISFQQPEEFDDDSIMGSLDALLAHDDRPEKLRQEFSGAWGSLAPELRELWEVLVEEEGCQGAAAKRLGKHRNTVALWLRQIREVLKAHGFLDG